MASDPGCDVALEGPSYTPRPVVVVACGGRELAWEPGAVRTALLAAVSCRWVLALFHGGARGADQLVEYQAGLAARQWIGISSASVEPGCSAPRESQWLLCSRTWTDGISLAEFVELFPGVTQEQARSVLEHAARSTAAAVA